MANIKIDQQSEHHYGFVQVPRIVLHKYNNLSYGEKMLYICLRDICGKGGTCYRRLRTLSEETKIPLGTLCPMIPKLHDAGLIHAEKKKRTARGHEVWHISIIDIWELNDEYVASQHSKVGSVSEQTSRQDTGQDDSSVPNPNELVRDPNKAIPLSRSFCSETSTRMIQMNNTKENEKITAQSPNGDVCLPSSPSLISTHKGRRPRPTEQASNPELTPSKQARTRKPDVDPEMLEQAKATMEQEIGGRVIWEPQYVRSMKELIRSGGTCEEIAMVVQRLKADKWHKDKVTVPYVIKEFPNQLAQASLSIPADTPTQEDKPSRYDDPDFDPRTLSNTEYAEWTAWLAAHEPIKP